MNKRYEEGREPFFSESGEKMRKQYVWTKNEEGQEVLQETAPIDIQQEIESYADECDIKNIVRKASFDPQFLKSLSEGALNDTNKLLRNCGSTLAFRTMFLISHSSA